MPETAAIAVPPSMRFGFVKLWVRDIERAARFYEQVLGWIVARTIDLPDKLEKMLHVAGQEQGPFLVLCERKEPEEIVIGNGWAPIGLFVDDSDAIYARALAYGGTPRLAPFDIDQMRVAFFFDPEGHEIELVAPKK